MLNHLGNYVSVLRDTIPEAKPSSYPPHRSVQYPGGRYGAPPQDYPVYSTVYSGPQRDVYVPGQMHVPHAFKLRRGGGAVHGRRGATRDRVGPPRRNIVGSSAESLPLDRSLSELSGKVRLLPSLSRPTYVRCHSDAFMKMVFCHMVTRSKSCSASSVRAQFLYWH